MRHCFTPEVVFDGTVDWPFRLCVGMCGIVWKLKFANSPVSSDDEDSRLPVYENPPAKYNAERTIKILLQPDETRVCYVRETFCSDVKCILLSCRQKPSETRWHQEGRIWHMELFWLTPSGLQSVITKKMATWQSKNAVKVHLELTWYFFAPCQIRCECACVCLCVRVWGEGQYYLVHSQLKN